jgi:hypothetical protein
MKISAIVLFVLSGVLLACTPAKSVTQPISSPSLAARLPSIQSLSPTFTPLPSQTFTPAPSQTLTPTAKLTQTSAPTSTISREANLILEGVAQLGGSINGITIVGDVAFVGMGPRAAAIDISDHQKPQLISQSEPLPGLVTQSVQVSQGTAPLLVVSAGKYLVVIDTSSPDGLKSIHQLELPGVISVMAWDPTMSILYAGGSIYQAPFEYSGFIAVLDLTLDHRLKMMNSTSLPEQPISLALGEGSLYVGTYSYTVGLYRIKLEAPGKLSTPQVVIASNSGNTFTFYSMQVVGNRLYAGVNMEMQAYDITNPDQPTQVWSEFIGFSAYGFSTDGAQIDIFGWAGAGTYLPTQATLIPSEPVTGAPFSQVASIVAWHKDDFLVAYEDLEIYATNDTQRMELVSSFQPAVIEVLGAASDGQAVYVVDNGAGDGKNKAILRIFSLPDLRPLGQVATDVTNSWGWFCGLAVEGDRAYLAAIDGLWAYDLSSPSPTLLNKLDIIEGGLNTVAAFKLGDRRILILSQESSLLGGLAEYDVTDIKNPARIGSPLKVDQGLIYQLAWDGDTLYAVGSTIHESDSDVLYLASFEGEDLTLRGKIPVPDSILSMAADNGLVALAGTAGLTLVSATDARYPEILAQVPLPERGLGIALLKGIALVMAGGNNGAAQLLAFDVQDLANPRQVKSMDIAFNAGVIGPIPTSNRYMILAGWSTGVEVWESSVSSTCLDTQAKPQDVPLREQPLEVRFISDGNIWVWDEGAPARLVTDTGDTLFFTFSPDGQVIAFERVHGEYPWGHFKIELWAINRDGNDLRQLVSADQFDQFLPVRHEDWVANVPTDMRWFSGTHQLTFGMYPWINAVGGGDNAEGYWIVDTDTLALKRWDHPQAIDHYGPIKFSSPDGKVLALVDRESISLLNADGSIIYQDVLTYHVNSAGEGYGWRAPYVAWSPNSVTLKVVVWDGDPIPSEKFSTWVIPATGSPASKLHTFSGMWYFSSVSPNQEYIAYLHRPDPMVNDNELHLARFDGSADIIYATDYQLYFEGWAPDSFHFTYDLFAGQQPRLGSICGGHSALIDESQTPATQITWVDVQRFLFVLGQEVQLRHLLLGQVGGESTLLGLFNGQWAYFQFRQDGQDVIVP